MRRNRAWPARRLDTDPLRLVFRRSLWATDILGAARNVNVAIYRPLSAPPPLPVALPRPTAAPAAVVDHWPDESWLDVRSVSLRAIIEAHLDAAVAKGGDRVEPDNGDGCEP